MGYVLSENCTAGRNVFSEGVWQNAISYSNPYHYSLLTSRLGLLVDGHSHEWIPPRNHDFAAAPLPYITEIWVSRCASLTANSFVKVFFTPLHYSNKAGGKITIPLAAQRSSQTANCFTATAAELCRQLVVTSIFHKNWSAGIKSLR